MTMYYRTQLPSRFSDRASLCAILYCQLRPCQVAKVHDMSISAAVIEYLPNTSGSISERCKGLKDFFPTASSCFFCPREPPSTYSALVSRISSSRITGARLSRSLSKLSTLTASLTLSLRRRQIRHDRLDHHIARNFLWSSPSSTLTL